MDEDNVAGYIAKAMVAVFALYITGVYSAERNYNSKIEERLKSLQVASKEISADMKELRSKATKNNYASRATLDSLLQKKNDIEVEINTANSQINANAVKARNDSWLYIVDNLLNP